MKCGIGLYVHGSAQAAALYCEAFGLELGYHVKNADGSFFHSELCCDGQEVFDVVESKDAAPCDDIVQVGMELANEDAVRRAFALLSEGGKIETPLGPLPWSDFAGALRDKFGVRWYLSVPQHRPDDDFTPETNG